MTRTDSYHVEASRRTCHECRATFEPNDEYVSALYEVDADEGHPHGMRRLDFCLEHWPANRAEQLAFWRTRVPEPTEPKRKPIVIDDSRLLEVFLRLEGADDPAKLDFRYVIGLMLLRKRRLKLTGTRTRGGHKYMLVRKTRSKQIYELMDRQLSDAAIMEVSEQIGTLLDIVENDGDASTEGEVPDEA